MRLVLQRAPWRNAIPKTLSPKQVKKWAKETMNPNNIKMSELQKKKVLGEGTFGRVELVYHPRTKTSWALKMMKVQIAEAKQQKACMLEKGYGVSGHPFILRLEATYQDAHLLYMLLECVGERIVHCWPSKGLDRSIRSCTLLWGMCCRRIFLHA